MSFSEYNYPIYILIIFLIFTICWLTIKIKYFFYKKRQKSYPLNYFKGINYLLNQKESEALKEFTNAVKVSSDNAEVYILLGNIYRNRGDSNKAVRIHQTVLANSNINFEIKKIALLSLAKDFKQSGFYKRALDTLEELLRIDKKNLQALNDKATILIRMRNWNEAIDTYKKLCKITNNYRVENFSSLYVELAKENSSNFRFFKIKFNFKKAFDIYNENSYGYAMLGDYFLKKGNVGKAFENYMLAVKNNSFSIILLRCKLNVTGKNYIENLDDNTTINIVLKAREFIKSRKYEEGLLYLKKKILQFPDDTILQRLYILLKSCLDSDFDTVRTLKKHIKLKFVCTCCEIVLKQYKWQCPNCKNWLSLNYLK